MIPSVCSLSWEAISAENIHVVFLYTIYQQFSGQLRDKKKINVFV